MVLGIIIAAVEIILLPIMLVGIVFHAGPLTTFFLDFVLIVFMVASLVDLIVCIARIKRLHGNRKGRAIAGVVISAHTLLIAFGILIGVLAGARSLESYGSTPYYYY